MSKLSSFEGREVSSAGLEIRNAAGGLNAAMKVDPEEWHHEDEVTVVMRCKVAKIRHDPIKDTDALRRVHVLDASEATVIDDSIVAEALEEQAKRIEIANGIHQLPIKLQAAHDAGEHTELVEGCPSCDREAEAAAAEASSG